MRLVLGYHMGRRTSRTPTVEPPKPPTITISPTTLARAPVDVVYSFQCSATGGRTPYEWILELGEPPAGLTLAANGLITGVPTTAGTTTFSLVCVDADGFRSDSTEVSLEVFSGGAVAYSGPRIGFGVWVRASGNVSVPWESDPAFKALKDLGVDWFALNRTTMAQYGGTGSWDDHAWADSLVANGDGTSTYYNDLGNPISAPAVPQGIQFPSYLQGMAYCGLDWPGSFSHPITVSWTDDSWWTTFCNRYTNLARWASGGNAGNYKPGAAAGSFFEGFVYDFEDTEKRAFRWTNTGLTEAVARQKAYERGAQWMTALLAGWSTATVGHGPRFIVYHGMKIPGTWAEEARRRTNNPSFTMNDNLYWEFWAGASSVAGWDAIWALFHQYYRFPGGGLAADAAGWDYAIDWDAEHWRAIVNYNNPADPYNAYRQWGTPGRVGWGMFEWFDSDGSTSAFGGSTQSPAAATLETSRGLTKVEGIMAVFIRNSTNYFSPYAVDYSQYTGSIGAYSP